MKIWQWISVAVVAVSAGVAASAQVSLYGIYQGSRMTGLTCFDPQNKCSSTGGTLSPSGGFGGVEYDFKTYGPVRLGVDVRGGEQHSNKSASTSGGGTGLTTNRTILGGVRASVKVPFVWLKPYGEIAAGWTRSNVTESQVANYDNFLHTQVFVGADVSVAPFLSIRAIELGYGTMNRIGNGQGPSNVPIGTIGAGIVVHLPKL